MTKEIDALSDRTGEVIGKRREEKSGAVLGLFSCERFFPLDECKEQASPAPGPISLAGATTSAG